MKIKTNSTYIHLYSLENLQRFLFQQSQLPLPTQNYLNGPFISCCWLSESDNGDTTRQIVMHRPYWWITQLPDKERLSLSSGLLTKRFVGRRNVRYHLRQLRNVKYAWCTQEVVIMPQIDCVRWVDFRDSWWNNGNWNCNIIGCRMR